MSMVRLAGIEPTTLGFGGQETDAYPHRFGPRQLCAVRHESAQNLESLDVSLLVVGYAATGGVDP